MINLCPGHRRHGRTPQTGEYSYISLVTTNTTLQYNQSLPTQPTNIQKNRKWPKQPEYAKQPPDRINC